MSPLSKSNSVQKFTAVCSSSSRRMSTRGHDPSQNTAESGRNSGKLPSLQLGLLYPTHDNRQWRRPIDTTSRTIALLRIGSKLVYGTRPNPESAPGSQNPQTMIMHPAFRKEDLENQGARRYTNVHCSTCVIYRCVCVVTRHMRVAAFHIASGSECFCFAHAHPARYGTCSQVHHVGAALRYKTQLMWSQPCCTNHNSRTCCWIWAVSWWRRCTRWKEGEEENMVAY